MNKKDLKRVKRQSEARMKQLAAAFRDETGLKASATAIHQTVRLDEHQQPVYMSWFAPLHYNPSEFHPDIMRCLDLMTAATNANAAGEFDKIKDEWFAEVKRISDKYTEQL